MIYWLINTTMTYEFLVPKRITKCSFVLNDKRGVCRGRDPLSDEYWARVNKLVDNIIILLYFYFAVSLRWSMSIFFHFKPVSFFFPSNYILIYLKFILIVFSSGFPIQNILRFLDLFMNRKTDFKKIIHLILIHFPWYPGSYRSNRASWTFFHSGNAEKKLVEIFLAGYASVNCQWAFKLL